MCEYKIRDGVVLLNICDQDILVSTIACREKCPYVKRINQSAAYYFRMMEQGLSVEEMARKTMREYEIDDYEQILNDIEEYIVLLKHGGYLLSDEEMKEVQ